LGAAMALRIGIWPLIAIVIATRLFKWEVV
jgi:hypothetical protein